MAATLHDGQSRCPFPFGKRDWTLRRGVRSGHESDAQRSVHRRSTPGEEIGAGDCLGLAAERVLRMLVYSDRPSRWHQDSGTICAHLLCADSRLHSRARAPQSTYACNWRPLTKRLREDIPHIQWSARGWSPSPDTVSPHLHTLQVVSTNFSRQQCNISYST